MSRRIIYIPSEQKENPDAKVFGAFKKDIISRFRDRVIERLQSGQTTSLDLYRSLGSPHMYESYERICPPGELGSLAEKIKSGELCILESSWGKRELEEEPSLAKTSPGPDDFHPSSCGWNNNGGPTWDIYVTEGEIVVDANVAYQDLGDSWDRVDTSFHWQTRRFRIRPSRDDDKCRETMLDIFRPWIINRFVKQNADLTISGIASRIADDMFDEAFGTFSKDGEVTK